MPELPEVEVSRRQWTRWMGGQPVTEAVLVDPAVVRHRASTSPRQAHPEGPLVWSRLVGRRLTGTSRVGKRLALDFDGARWLQHLGMTGRLVRRAPGALPPRHARAGVRTGQASIWLVDTRRFGCLVPLEGEASGMEGLGPDALDASWDGVSLAERVRSRGAIKQALMDQGRIAGLGNIQVVEILFAAGVHPSRRADDLSDEAWARLAAAMDPVLRAAVDATDQDDDVVYLSDGGDNPFVVYGREGQPCVRCGATIQRWSQGGRSTYACARCQPEG